MVKKHCICPIPFHQVFIQSSGKVFPCAFLQNHTLLGDVKEEKLSDIIKAKKFTEFKKNHLEGHYEECSKNQKTFSCHKTLKGYEVPQTNPEGQALRRIDFMVDSFCNLKCIMCTNVYEENGGFEQEEFWEDFKSNILPNLYELELIGGEPLLVKNTFKTLEIIKEVNPACKVKLTTNGAFRLSQRVKDSLQGVNLINLGYSIDSLKEDIFRAIRPGGELSQVLETLEDFIQWKDQHHLEFNIEVNFVVQRLNAFEVPSFLQFIRSKGLIPYLIYLNHPIEHSLSNATSEERQEILKFYIEDFKVNKDPEMAKLIMTLYKKLQKDAQLKFANEIIDLQKQSA